MRTAFSDALVRLAVADPDVLLLTGDHGYALFDEFRRRCPAQYINAGIAEQNMVGMAAGLARTGFRPIVYGLSAFVPIRVLEQIKLDVAHDDLPVIFIGDGAGFVYSHLGTSHQSTEDIACTRAIPQLAVLSPADRFEVTACRDLAYAAHAPVYVRLGKSDRGDVHDGAPVGLGMGDLVAVRAGRPGGLTLIATGSMVSTALRVADLRGDGAAVWSAPSLKPIDRARVAGLARESRGLVVLEEHSEIGGLGAAVAEITSELAPVKVLRIGVADRFSQKCGTYTSTCCVNTDSTPRPSRNASMPSQQLSEPIDLSSRRVLVTGGTGFLGRTLLDYVEESVGVHGPGVEVSVLSRDPDAFLRRFPCYARLGWLRLMAGDVQQPHLPAGEFTDIIHAAADTHGHEQPLPWIRQIVDGTAAMLEYARLQGVERFLYVSSGAVYGPQPVDTAALAEDHPGAPPTELMSSVYGQAKRLAEQLCTVYHREHGLQTVTARCFAIVGEHVPLSGPYAMGNFLRDALAGNPISVTGDGTAVRTYLYGRDTAHWMMALLLRGEPGEAYNVGSDEEASIAEVARLVASIVRPGLPVAISATPNAGNGRNRYVPDIAKARRLGLRVETPLAPAIRLTVDRIAAAAGGAAPCGGPAAARA